MKAQSDKSMDCFISLTFAFVLSQKQTSTLNRVVRCPLLAQTVLDLGRKFNMECMGKV